MNHLAHRNHKHSIWKRSAFHLKNWLSLTETEKIKISKILPECLQASHRYTSVPNFIQKEQNCDRQAGDKFFYNKQTTDRRHENFSLQFLSPRGPNVQKKSFSSIGRKIIFETVAMYVLRDSGHIINYITAFTNYLIFIVKIQVKTQDAKNKEAFK